jgi:hypothetical protein
LISAPIWPFDIWLIDGLEPPRRPLPWLLVLLCQIVGFVRESASDHI